MYTSVDPQDPDLVKKRLDEKENQRELSFAHRSKSPRNFHKREQAITLFTSGFSKKTTSND